MKSDIRYFGLTVLYCPEIQDNINSPEILKYLVLEKAFFRQKST